MTQQPAEQPPRQARRLAWWLAVAAIVLPILTLLPYVSSGTELARVRNALTFQSAPWAALQWTPSTRPISFLLDKVAPDQRLVAIVGQMHLDRLPSDWDRAVAIADHLLTSNPTLTGGPIMAGMLETYRRIAEQGEGYCADFVRVFRGLAVAAGIHVRTWGFSFDGFGGHGHVWVEVWNRQAGKWQLLDVFNNYYFTDTAVDGSHALSALQLRQALLGGSDTVQLNALAPSARAGFVHEKKAWQYFGDGLSEWYLLWGTNPFTYEQSAAISWLSPISRSLAQLGAIAQRVRPRPVLLATSNNQQQIAALHRVRLHFQAAASIVAIGLVGLGVLLLHRRRMHIRVCEHTCTDPLKAKEAQSMGADWPRVCIVGPLPPPSGGMANQCEQLLRLLRAEGAAVELVRTNTPYRPAWIGSLRWLRALWRQLPYLIALWQGIGRAQVVHVFANSGWAWHLLAAPALTVARARGVPVIVNYRGGLADEFLASAPRHVRRALAGAALRITPSAFLLRVFAKHGLSAEVIPNIIDLSRFACRPLRAAGDAPHLIVTRNLEAIYDIGTAIRAFALVRANKPGARLTVAGTGPQRAELQALAATLGVADAVHFAGRIANADIAALYADADIALNPSTADNMPISILEALATGVPVVSTCAGGIPDLVTHEQTALLVAVGDPAAMADAALRILADHELAQRLHDNGSEHVARFAWPNLRALWQTAYRQAAASRRWPRRVAV